MEPLRRAVTIDPSRDTTHYHLGEAYNRIDQRPAELAPYEAAAVRDQPRDGLLRLHQNDYAPRILGVGFNSEHATRTRIAFPRRFVASTTTTWGSVAPDMAA